MPVMMAPALKKPEWWWGIGGREENGTGNALVGPDKPGAT